MRSSIYVVLQFDDFYVILQFDDFYIVSRTWNNIDIFMPLSTFTLVSYVKINSLCPLCIVTHLGENSNGFYSFFTFPNSIWRNLWNDSVYEVWHDVIWRIFSIFDSAVDSSSNNFSHTNQRHLKQDSKQL